MIIGKAFYFPDNYLEIVLIDFPFREPSVSSTLFVDFTIIFR